MDERKRFSEAGMERCARAVSKLHYEARQAGAEQVRLIATSAVRDAANRHGLDFYLAAIAPMMLTRIISGEEEAQLSFMGATCIPRREGPQGMIDIGGGSTEFVIGSDLQPTDTESLPLGCVTYSMRFFQGKIGQKDFQAATTAARNEIQRISKLLKRTGWDFAVGTSGSAKSIRDVIAAEYGDDEESTYAGMQKIAARIIEAGSTKKARFEGLKPDRIEVFAGGLAVMMAAFEELDIKKMMVTDAALRDGVFYDFIGRQLNEDMRDQTTAQFQQR